jgi:recombination protein RecT
MKKNELVQKDFEIIKSRFLKLSDEETFLKEISFAMQIFRSNSYLNSATMESKLESVINLAQTDLTLNPVMKLAYLIPRFVDGKVKCCVEASYQGLIKLITDTGSAQSIYAHCVYQGDDFDVQLGTQININHKPAFESDVISHVYSVAVLHDGTKQVEVMTAQQVMDIREGSESYKAHKAGKIKSCIWVDHFGEMAKKTVVKRLVKYLPKTDRFEKLGNAIEIENEDFQASHDQLDYIDSLIISAAITPMEFEAIEQEKSYMSAERASHVISYLKENQVSPIDSGEPYDQGDIKQKMDKHI